MAHVVAEPCLGCKYTDCVVVCPVDCFRDGRHMLYIHPLECIDCAACVAACPAQAIFHENELPDDWVPYRDLNATMARQLARVTPTIRSPSSVPGERPRHLPDWIPFRWPALRRHASPGENPS